MTDGAGTTAPLWMPPADTPRFPDLDVDLRTNVCIVVGAGVAGLTTALLLAREERAVVVGPIAGGATGRTTAHLSSVLDRFQEIERRYGEHGVRIA